MGGESGAPAPWSGSWVGRRLDVTLDTTHAPVGVGLEELVGLAVRRNPRRAHLLVSAVLGKHVPTHPELVHGSGLLLGRLVSAALPAAAGAPHPTDLGGGRLLRQALDGVPGAPGLLLDHARGGGAPVADDVVVLGYAETATALGHAVADALRAPYLHSTRRAVAGVTAVGRFEEEHSHATSHLLLPDDPRTFTGSGPLVLVDDELSTGTTALNTIAALHRDSPRSRYLVAALVDLRSDADRARMEAAGAELGARIDVVALAAGRVGLPPDVLARGDAVVADAEARQAELLPRAAAGELQRVDVGWPDGLREGGRHGFTDSDRTRLETSLPAMAETLAGAVGLRARRVHVLGVEELMYAPLRLGAALVAELAATGRGDVAVTYSTTTRSPVLAVPDPGYAIRSRLSFPAHDRPSDGPGSRFAYNVAPAAPGTPGPDTVVLVVDDVGDTAELAAPGGLLTQLTHLCDRVLVVTVPAHAPLPSSDRETA